MFDLKYRLRVARLGRIEASRRYGVSIGTGCRIYSRVVTSEPWLVSIGSNVTISEDVRLITHDGSGWLVRDTLGRRFRYAPISIGDECFIGAGSILLPGVELGSRVIVGAGTVVTRSVPSGSVVAGNPARQISTFDEFHAKALRWRSGSDMHGGTYKERVDSIVEPLHPTAAKDSPEAAREHM